MEITTCSRSLEVTDELRDHVARRVHFALDAFGEHIGTVEVQLEDLNGPRGGVDKRCVITAAVQKVGTLVVRVSAATLNAAVSRASRTLKYRVSEKLRQLQQSDTDSIRRKPVAA